MAGAVSYNETVQDETNDFLDTQSRLTNLRAEQPRLLTLLSQAQNLGDTLQVEQRLTDVEGQIENIEVHLEPAQRPSHLLSGHSRAGAGSPTRIPSQAVPWDLKGQARQRVRRGASVCRVPVNV